MSYEDLRPWAETGITKEMMEAVNDPTFFRPMILDRKVHMEKYNGAFQILDKGCVHHMGIFVPIILTQLFIKNHSVFFLPIFHFFFKDLIMCLV